MWSMLRSQRKHPQTQARPNSNTPPGWRVGLMDQASNGWFKQATGQLAEGFVITPDDTVLDVGCGEGGACLFAARRGAEVIASDVDPEAIAKLHQKLQDLPARAFQALVSDSNPLPLADSTANKVIAMEVLEHVDDPVQFMGELVRVGCPGAQFLITVPDPVAEEVQRDVASPSYWTKPNHLRIFQRNQLDQLVEDSGLIIERRMQTGFFWALWWVLFWAVDQQFGEPEAPLLENWTKTWYALLSNPKGEAIRKALDKTMPKSQVLVARKPA